MPAKKPFVMENPEQILPGQWRFRLYADPHILDMVQELPLIGTTTRFETMLDYANFWINPRYDYEEAWLAICEFLETETQIVPLDAIWGVDDDR